MTNVISIVLKTGKQIDISFDSPNAAFDAAGSISMVGLLARNEDNKPRMILPHQIAFIDFSEELPNNKLLQVNEIVDFDENL